MTSSGYTRAKKTGELGLWMGQRAVHMKRCAGHRIRSPSLTVYRWPGKLEYVVSGGIKRGHNSFDTLLAEGEEEASLTEAFTKSRAKLSR